MNMKVDRYCCSSKWCNWSQGKCNNIIRKMQLTDSINKHGNFMEYVAAIKTNEKERLDLYELLEALKKEKRQYSLKFLLIHACTRCHY